MIPAILFWLLRRYRRNLQKAIGAYIMIKKVKKRPCRIVAILVFVTLFLALKGYTQNRSLNYRILRNGNKVGTLRFTESSSGNTNYLQLESDVKTRFIFTFTAHAEEQAIYSNGILLRSSIYRKLNGNERANKKHQVQNNRYLIQAGKNAAVSKIFPITYNMLSLYTREPSNISSVYSDNFETSLEIQKAGVHKYKINFPDGNHNYYSYKDGILNEIEIHHSLYSANIVLTQ
jgi:hypothetical protein